MSVTRRDLLGAGLGAMIGAAGGYSAGARPASGEAAAAPPRAIAALKSPLHIYMTGLCMIGVKTSGASLGHVKVLLPDVTKFALGGRKLHPHKAMLCIPKRFTSSGASDHKNCCDPDMWTWPLDGMDVTFKIDGTELSDEVKTIAVTPAGAYPYGDEWRATQWLVHLNDLTYGATIRVKSDYATAPHGGEIACRVNLAGGQLGGFIPGFRSRNPNVAWRGRMVDWEFDDDNPSAKLTRMMSDVARYESPAAMTLQICLKKSGSNACTEIDLSIPGDGTPVPIYIQNLIADYCTDPVDTSTIHHFKVFYAMSEWTNAPTFFPVPAHRGKVAGFPGCRFMTPPNADDPIYCPPPRAEL